ncbi:hypothetical protein [Daejeonella sp. JGW-45]|uniref:hypothetical protein n=1 Tax=Daejeonella sp. JGW-45 TaxID=3034148 RepID=UPI0023EC2CCE|nr:hypothetical protein [Daejeonella sp. JGW-45]
MRIRYRILWFEDDEQYFEEDLQPEIKSFVESKGFIYDCTHRKTGADLDTLISSSVYDLIISDLNLGADETGEKLIEYIRDDKHVLTEVLLYSANEAALQQIVSNKGWIERASFSIGLGNLPPKLKSIIQFSIRKVEDVNNLRGLVIAESIDLEKKIENVLQMFFEAAEDLVSASTKEEVLSSIYTKKLENHNEHASYIEKIKLGDIKELIDQDVLTTNNTYEAVQGILKNRLKGVNARLNGGGISNEDKAVLAEKQAQLTQLRTEFINFKKEIIDIRNILAHVEEKTDEDGKPYLQSMMRGRDPIKFDDGKYIEVRKNLQKHSNNLNLITEHILQII